MALDLRENENCKKAVDEHMKVFGKLSGRHAMTSPILSILVVEKTYRTNILSILVLEKSFRVSKCKDRLSSCPASVILCLRELSYYPLHGRHLALMSWQKILALKV